MPAVTSGTQGFVCSSSTDDRINMSVLYAELDALSDNTERGKKGARASKDGRRWGDG